MVPRKILALVVLMGAVVFATTGPALARGRAVELPIRGTWSGQQVEPVGVECPAGTQPRRTIGNGEASHFGRFELVAEGCVDLAIGQGSGVVSYTTANGDEFYIEFESQFSVSNGRVTQVAIAIGSSGTGRFATAVIDGTDTATGTLGDPRVHGMMEATITYNPADVSQD